MNLIALAFNPFELIKDSKYYLLKSFAIFIAVMAICVKLAYFLEANGDIEDFKQRIDPQYLLSIFIFILVAMIVWAGIIYLIGGKDYSKSLSVIFLSAAIASIYRPIYAVVYGISGINALTYVLLVLFFLHFSICFINGISAAQKFGKIKVGLSLILGVFSFYCVSYLWSNVLHFV